MKKIIIFAFLLFTTLSQAQLEVAPYDFQNGDDLQGWSIIDQDNTNGSTWAIRDNFYSTIMGSEAIPVLSLTQLGGPGSASEWAILPVQDLSFYSGTHLNLTYLQGLFEAEVDMELSLYAFVSETTPTVADFLTTQPIATISLIGADTDPPTEASVITDIPAAYNVENVHFALVYSWLPAEEAPGSGALELTKIAITADEVAGIKDITATTTIVKQNPVTETLQLQLSTALNANALQLQVYNVNGTLVKETKYSEGGVPVSDLANGIYFAVLTNGTAVERLKFIKK